MSEQEPGAEPSSRANVVLALLLLAYIFNFLDRQILGILAGPIKADLSSATPSSARSAASPSRSSIRCWACPWHCLRTAPAAAG
jgi:hypothetical protein